MVLPVSFSSRMKVAHARRVKIRFGPLGFLESRTATAWSRWATSTHWPLALLWLLFCHLARERSGSVIPYLLSPTPLRRGLRPALWTRPGSLPLHGGARMRVYTGEHQPLLRETGRRPCCRGR